MNSAAVIGRQLRQQQSNSRVSGPVVPPTQYRGRRQSQVALKHDRDLLSLPTGADADKKFAKFSQLYSHEHSQFYPHPAHREKSEKTNHRKKKKKKENGIKCTWHCFCVALKALSSGIILLLVGTVMSAVGFFADSVSEERIQHEDGTITTSVNNDLKNHLHNLTYVGPVIMGLGGIVIVAACVLTFEVRDTLGVKIDPNHDKDNESSEDDNIKVVPNSSSRQKSPSKISTIQPSHLEVNVMNGSSCKKDPAHPLTQLPQANPLQDYKKIRLKDDCRSESSVEKVKCSTEPIVNALLTAQSQYANSISNESIALTELSYLRIPSPQETELSDPEGCSLNMTFTKWKSRCSCSGSPTNSMLLALHNLDAVQASSYCPYFEHGSSTPFASHLPNRHSKILASVESDGISILSSNCDVSHYRHYKSHPINHACGSTTSLVDNGTPTTNHYTFDQTTTESGVSLYLNQQSNSAHSLTSLVSTELYRPKDEKQNVANCYPLLKMARMDNRENNSRKSRSYATEV